MASRTRPETDLVVAVAAPPWPVLDATVTAVDVSPVIEAHGATATDLEAVLRALHAERRRLQELQRAGEATPEDVETLRDLRLEIDRLSSEAHLDRVRRSPVTERLETLAERVLRLAEASASRQRS
jgi:hypothetical protein